MARKKATAASAEVTTDPAPAETARPDVFDEAIANQQTAATIVQEVADNTRIPEQNGTSFSEKVGKREYKPVADPFGIATDCLAGVRLSESKRYGKMLLAFEEKPSSEVTATLKDAGFRWEPLEKVWTLSTRENPMSARIEAERVWKEVSKQIRTERGIDHSVGVSAS